MSEYIVAGCYLLFSLSGVFINLEFRRRFPGRKFKPFIFLCYLLVGVFFGIAHLGIMKYGYNVVYLPANQWIEGNSIVRVIAAMFFFPQLLIGPSFVRSKR